MKQPLEKDYISHVAYCRELEQYVAGLTNERAALHINCLDLELQRSALIAERDALQLANKDLGNWFDALKADYDKLKVAARLWHYERQLNDEP